MITQFHITKGIVMAKKNTTAQSQPQIDYDAIFQEQYDKQIATEERKYNRYMKQPHDTSNKQHRLEYMEKYKKEQESPENYDRLLAVLYSAYHNLIEREQIYTTNPIKNFFTRNADYHVLYHKNEVAKSQPNCKSLKYTEETLIKKFAIHCARESYRWILYRKTDNPIDLALKKDDNPENGLEHSNTSSTKDEIGLSDSVVNEVQEDKKMYVENYICVRQKSSFVRVMTSLRESEIIDFAVKSMVGMLKKSKKDDIYSFVEYKEADFNARFGEIYGDKAHRKKQDTLKPISRSQDPTFLDFIILLTQHLRPEDLRKLRNKLSENYNADE